MPPRRRKLVIVDDNPFFSACLSSLIDAERDLVVCGDARSSATLNRTLKGCSPDMIVLDLGLGPESGVGIARALRRRGNRTPVVFVSSLGAPSAATLKQIGRCAFWKKGGDDDGLLRLIRRTLSNYGRVPASSGRVGMASPAVEPSPCAAQ
jgi:chemotaxis response regulator CheB